MKANTPRATISKNVLGQGFIENREMSSAGSEIVFSIIGASIGLDLCVGRVAAPGFERVFNSSTPSRISHGLFFT